MNEVRQLAVPLAQSQIDAAGRFWRDGWDSKEIVQLKQAFPKCEDAVAVKAIVLNTLYGTSIIAIVKVARCVERVLNSNHSFGPGLVEELVAEMEKVSKRKNYSFAAKYAHFFVDPCLPILDLYAEWMVARHLGQSQSKNPKRYLKFYEDVETLKRAAVLTCDCAQLDAYLWVAGEYWYWKAHPKTKVSGDLMDHFERLTRNPEDERTLSSLLSIAVSA